MYCVTILFLYFVFFFKQKTAYEMRISDWSSDVCSSDLFDRLFDLLENSARLQQADNYPPFNIERLSDDRYRITLAVAGFRAEDIDIVAKKNLLQITGRKDEEGEQDRSNFLHMGLSNRGFGRLFERAGFFGRDTRVFVPGSR